MKTGIELFEEMHEAISGARNAEERGDDEALRMHEHRVRILAEVMIESGILRSAIKR